MTGRIAHRRLAAYEKRAFNAFSQVVAIGAPDIPRSISPSKTACVTPYLMEKPRRWNPEPSQEVFFVGGVNHYPNRLAIDYICTRLAPAVAVRSPSTFFTIIGAAEADVPPEWRHPAVRFLGRLGHQEVERHFTTCRLFICPVENNFGVKYKVLESLAYGTPFLASPETMLCVPHLKGQPTLPLDDPNRAAEEVVRLMESDTALFALSHSINTQHDRFISSQKNVWSRTLFRQKMAA